jgi:uncharacterized membrane protein YkgB
MSAPSEAPASEKQEEAEASQETTRLLHKATAPVRLALALLYFHFGFLKFFPDLSAAEMLSTQTILRMRLGIDAHTALYLLALFEVAIALMLVLRVPMRIVFPIFVLHILGAMSPLVLLPELAFKFAPFAPTMEGQYIFKNIVLLAAAWTLYRADMVRPPLRTRTTT